MCDVFTNVRMAVFDGDPVFIFQDVLDACGVDELPEGLLDGDDVAEVMCEDMRNGRKARFMALRLTGVLKTALYADDSEDEEDDVDNEEIVVDILDMLIKVLDKLQEEG